MLRLTIARHAKSSWDNHQVNDFNRVLNKRGQSDAPRMGKRLQQAGITPDCIICSPARRAMQTAQLLLAPSGIALEDITQEPLVYEASLANLQSIVENTAQGCQHLMIIGHNPGLEALCNYTEPGSVPVLTTCNIVDFELRIEQWNQFDRGCGKLLSHWTPKD